MAYNRCVGTATVPIIALAKLEGLTFLTGIKKHGRTLPRTSGTKNDSLPRWVIILMLQFV